MPSKRKTCDAWRKLPLKEMSGSQLDTLVCEYKENEAAILNDSDRQAQLAYLEQGYPALRNGKGKHHERVALRNLLAHIVHRIELVSGFAQSDLNDHMHACFKAFRKAYGFDQ